MKYPPHQLYKFLAQGYFAIVLDLFWDFILDKTHIAKFYFFLTLGVKVPQLNHHMNCYF